MITQRHFATSRLVLKGDITGLGYFIINYKQKCRTFNGHF